MDILSLKKNPSGGENMWKAPSRHMHEDTKTVGPEAGAGGPGVTAALVDGVDPTGHSQDSREASKGF